LGLSYVENFPLGIHPWIVMPRAEASAKEILSPLPSEATNQCDDSTTRLTIMRASDMSEIGFLLEITSQIGIWPCAWGRDPRMRPITSRDFGIAVGSFVKHQAEERDRPSGGHREASWLADFCVGGPQAIRWRELKGEVETATGGPPIRTLDLPLGLYRAAAALCRLGAPWSSRLEHALYLMVVAGIPMLENTTSDEHEVYGEDRVDEFLREYVAQARKHS
jgi:hypothetical protein